MHSQNRRNGAEARQPDALLELRTGRTPFTATELGALRAGVQNDPGNPQSWRKLARALRLNGERTAASVAFARSVTAAIQDTELADLERRVNGVHDREAEPALANRIQEDPDDIVAIRLLADLMANTGRQDQAERYYRHIIDLCPSYLPARHGLSRMLVRQARLTEAAIESERMLATAPLDPSARTLKAAIAASIGDHEDAGALYKGLVAERPDHPALWLGLGHSHRAVGRTGEAIDAYRHAATLDAGAAEAYWCLSNLKTFKFSEADVEAMISRASGQSISGQQAAYINFALGQHFHLEGERERAFEHFRLANTAKRATLSYDPDLADKRLQIWANRINPDMLPARSGGEQAAATPIFIVGLPRTGSTLLEQVLGAHPLIESTAELPYMDIIAGRIAREQKLSTRTGEPLTDIDAEALGREYLSRAQIHRKTSRPYFIDKLPGNFAHVPLIRLILPHARIIDIRRHPLATVWSVYKQLFWQGNPFAYELTEVARWYRGYVKLLDHFDATIPGAVLHLRYEDLVLKTEETVRGLLEQLAVLFDPACLRHHEQKSVVRTPSSEQVRQPIYNDALEEWRLYERHLEPAIGLMSGLAGEKQTA